MRSPEHGEPRGHKGPAWLLLIETESTGLGEGLLTRVAVGSILGGEIRGFDDVGTRLDHARREVRGG